MSWHAYTVGIDPGAKGGIAVVALSGRAMVWPMPTIGTKVDPVGLALLVRRIHAGEFSTDADKISGIPRLAAIERVHAMPKQGVASTFEFGRGYGAILGVLACYRWPTELVLPQRWKREVLAGTDHSKGAAVAYCTSRFPGASLTPGAKRSPQDGLADALCLAEFARRQVGVRL